MGGRCYQMNAQWPCQCDAGCQHKNNCCDDITKTCYIAGNGGTMKGGQYGTCQGRCHAVYDPKQPCQCNGMCHAHNNCCNDIGQKCGLPGGKSQTMSYGGSCHNRCYTYDPSKPCQCNGLCKWHGNCCFDISTWCPGLTASRLYDASTDIAVPPTGPASSPVLVWTLCLSAAAVVGFAVVRTVASQRLRASGSLEISPSAEMAAVPSDVE